jgi:hypothetical protein
MTDTHRTLVLADAATGSDEFAEAVGARCRENEEVFVVVPKRDRRGVARALSSLARGGVFAWGRTGPSDPLAAVADALRQFAADEILVVADAGSESHRLGVSTARRLLREFGLPVAHVRVGAGARHPLAPAVVSG